MWDWSRGVMSLNVISSEPGGTTVATAGFRQELCGGPKGEDSLGAPGPQRRASSGDGVD